MAKRGNAEGCIIKDPRGSGGYIARIQIGYNANGNPRIKSFSGKTKAEVRQRLRAFKTEMENLNAIVQADCTLAAGIRHWMEEYKKPFLKPSSYDRLTQTVENNLIPYIGTHLIKQISSGDIQSEVINKLTTEGLSRSSIKKAYEALNGFFRQYVIDGRLLRNPMEGVRLPAKDQLATKQMRALTSDEMNKFRNTALARAEVTGQFRYRYGAGFVLILYTGMREGEALALQYRHVDLENRCIHIEQNLVSVTDGSGNKHREPLIQRTTKTSAGKRDIPLCDTAYDAVKLYMDEYYKGDGNDYLFTTQSGKHLTPHNMAKSLNRIFRAADIQASGVHILRHSFASYLYERGADIKSISRILGHANVQITYDTYVHTDFEQLSKAVALVN